MLLTEEEYLAIERRAESRSEFYNGEMFALSGASRWHNLVETNLVIALGTQLREGPCNVYSNGRAWVYTENHEAEGVVRIEAIGWT
jgi:Uma2 family endonuclease